MGKDLKGKDLGQGISQRKDGRYNARATIEGVSINIYNYNLKALKKEFDLKKAAVMKKEFNVRQGITLNEWFNEWFEIYKSPNLKDELNRHNYKRRYNNTFGKYLGLKKMENITEVNIQQVVNDLIKIDGYSPKTVKESLSSLKECCNAAITNRLISLNPCLSVIVPCGIDDFIEPVVLSEKQQQTFLSLVKNRYYNEIYQIMLSTGMRIGEVTALQWSDIDFENKEINIKHSMQVAYEKGEKILNMTTPKTVNAIRTIPMFEGVEKLFLSVKEKQEICKMQMGKRWRLPKDLVFTTSLGSPVTRYVLASDINKVVDIIDKNEMYLAVKEHREPNKFPKLHPHAFRHTFATRCFQKGLEPLFIMKIMGHTNYETTLRYTHLLASTNEQEINKAGSFVASNDVVKQKENIKTVKVSKNKLVVRLKSA